jgi:hypothetical protein
LWHSITRDYDISDAAGIELLCLACQALDRAEAIADLISHAGVGAVNVELGAFRSNPLVKDELACRAFVAKQLERLGVNQEPKQAVGRPPGSWSYEKAEVESA